MNLRIATPAINFGAESIKRELRQYGAVDDTGIVRTIDTDYYFSKFSLIRVVKWAKDITVVLKDAIE
jgi:hypothetical protein